jgi:CRP/FNR family cyclic AMP-dependent transcriptional regulator
MKHSKEINKYEIEKIQKGGFIKGIAKVALFKDLASDDLADLANLLWEFKVNKGDAIYRRGMIGDALYIILEGAVKIVLFSPKGDERIVTIFSEGEFFGEMALLDGMPRSANAIAIKPSKLFFLNNSDFKRFLKKNDAPFEKILSALSARLRKTEELLKDISFLNLQARLAKKLLEIGKTFGHMDGNTLQINLKLTQKELGAMVGANRVQISTELGVLRKEGLISVKDFTISIYDIKGLKQRIR